MKRPIGQIKNPIPSGLSLHPIAFSSNNATGIKVFKSRITLNGNQANSCRINCTQLQPKRRLENLSIVSRIIIVIWWLDIFQHLHERKFAQWHTQNAKVVPKFYQIVNKPPKNRPRLWRFCQSGEISPNLVTLLSINLPSLKELRRCLPWWWGCRWATSTTWRAWTLWEAGTTSAQRGHWCRRPVARRARAKRWQSQRCSNRSAKRM